MPIEKIEMINFRNHKNMVIDFSPGINIIWGENGSGKTSILEAVYILSNGKSFKTNKLTEAIKNGSTETTLRARFENTTTTLHQAIGSPKKIKTNKISIITYLVLELLFGFVGKSQQYWELF